MTNSMTRNIKWAGALVPVLMLIAAAPAYAASISLTPSTISVVRGQTVTVQVVVDSGTAQTVTAEAQLSYPSSILTATSFTFAPSWIQLSQPGYDSMGGGTEIKTGGYPGGFTGSKVLGTATFTATQSGTATIAVTSGSQTFSSQGGNTLTAPFGTTAVTVGGTTSQTTTTTTNAAGQTTTVQTTGTNGTTNTSVTTTGTTPAPVAAGTATTSDNSSQAAAVGATGAASSVPTWAWIVGAIVLLGLVAWGVRSMSKNA